MPTQTLRIKEDPAGSSGFTKVGSRVRDGFRRHSANQLASSASTPSDIAVLRELLYGALNRGGSMTTETTSETVEIQASAADQRAAEQSGGDSRDAEIITSATARCYGAGSRARRSRRFRRRQRNCRRAATKIGKDGNGVRTFSGRLGGRSGISTSATKVQWTPTRTMSISRC